MCPWHSITVHKGLQKIGVTKMLPPITKRVGTYQRKGDNTMDQD